jgi:hypothetical protein
VKTSNNCSVGSRACSAHCPWIAANYGPKEKKISRRGWTQFSRGDNSLLLTITRIRGQRFALPLATVACATIAAHSAAAQASPPPLPAHISTAHPPSAKSPATISAHRNDELTLAGLRPGQDDFTKAQKLFRKPSLTKFDGTNLIWRDTCRNQSLSIITAPDSGTIQEVRVSENNSKFTSATPSSTVAESRCGSSAGTQSRWLTGHGLIVGSSCSRTLELYGQPGSRGPSTKDGQQLELLYYAFDWAGPDVPQVMAVLCTPGSSGKPGRVVEITLMAPSL